MAPLPVAYQLQRRTRRPSLNCHPERSNRRKNIGPYPEDPERSEGAKDLRLLFG